MVAFQAVDPGSTPGRRTLLFLIRNPYHQISKYIFFGLHSIYGNGISYHISSYDIITPQKEIAFELELDKNKFPHRESNPGRLRERQES